MTKNFKIQQGVCGKIIIFAYFCLFVLAWVENIVKNSSFFCITKWSLAKIWYPIEVAEVEIAVSGGCQSGQGPDEKKSIKN